MKDDILIKKYIINNRMSGMFHPTRDNIMQLLYEAQHSSETTKNKIKSYFKHLNGEQGEINSSQIIKMQFYLMNYCFYFCEYLVENNINSEVVYNTSDYFVDQIANIKNEIDFTRLFIALADAFFDLLNNKREIKFSNNVEKAIRYINNKKLEEAKAMLKYTNEPITTISSTLGFNSSAHFSTFFKKSTGISPRDYRKK